MFCFWWGWHISKLLIRCNNVMQKKKKWKKSWNFRFFKSLLVTTGSDVGGIYPYICSPLLKVYYPYKFIVLICYHCQDLAMLTTQFEDWKSHDRKSILKKIFVVTRDICNLNNVSKIISNTHSIKYIYGIVWYSIYKVFLS